MARTKKEKARAMAEDVIEQLRKGIYSTACRCGRKTKNDGLVMAAHAMAYFHMMMSVLAYAKKAQGYYPHLKNHFEVDMHPGIVRGLAEEACVVMGEYFSDFDPYFEYEVRLIRRVRG